MFTIVRSRINMQMFKFLSAPNDNRSTVEMRVLLIFLLCEETFVNYRYFQVKITCGEYALSRVSAWKGG